MEQDTAHKKWFLKSITIFKVVKNGNTTICFIRLQLYCYNLPMVVFYKHIIYTAVKKTLLLWSGLSLPVNTTEETTITINQVFR